MTLSGILLPPQLLYERKTDRCHPHVKFPPDWDIFHTHNHWSNTTTVLRFIDKVLNLYLQKKTRRAGLLECQKALLILDVFRAHRTTKVQQKLSESNNLVVFAPANCIDRLQPLNLSLNKPFKNEMRKHFVEWYSSCELKSGKSVNDINIGLQMSVIKPLSATWFISAYDYIHSSPDIICNGFRAAGIFHILNVV